MPIKTKKQPFGRIINILAATNFITISAASKKIKLKLADLKQRKTLQEKSENALISGFQISKELLVELRDLESYLIRKKYPDITKEKKEQLISQILAFKVLEYYLAKIKLPQEIKNWIIPPTEDYRDKYFNSPNRQESGTFLANVIKAILDMNFTNIETFTKEIGICPATFYQIKNAKYMPEEEAYDYEEYEIVNPQNKDDLVL